jgi:predicted nucleotide-binding protein (sugar kinase/HSP70/actin superfamily)
VEFLKTDAAMVVNCAPFGCMPVNITSALLNPIQQYYRRPVVTMYYDGESEANKIVEVYLHNVKNKINDEKELLKL